MKWRTVTPAKIDRHLSANGAHSAPKSYELVDKDGTVLARVRQQGGLYRYFIGEAMSGGFTNVRTAKAAAEGALARIGVGR